MQWPVGAGVRVIHPRYGAGITEPLTKHSSRGFQPVRFDSDGRAMRVRASVLEPEPTIDPATMDEILSSPGPLIKTVADADPPDRCDVMGCHGDTVCQVLFRTSKNAPLGNSGKYPRYVLSNRLCQGHGDGYADNARNHGYDNVEVLPL